jgi:hypothetical protein
MIPMANKRGQEEKELEVSGTVESATNNELPDLSRVNE